MSRKARTRMNAGRFRIRDEEAQPAGPGVEGYQDRFRPRPGDRWRGYGELLGGLEAADARLTPEHVAARYRELEATLAAEEL